MIWIRNAATTFATVPRFLFVLFEKGKEKIIKSYIGFGRCRYGTIGGYWNSFARSRLCTIKKEHTWLITVV
jgi:hypothetical protein